MAVPPDLPGLELLVVCRANVYRSVLAEHLLFDWIFRRQLVGWRVQSAGTAAIPGRQMDPDVHALLVERSITPEPSWRSRRLDAEALAGADLVLTSDRTRSAEVTSLDPHRARTVFTIRQLARFARSIDAEGRVAGNVLSGDTIPAQLFDAVRLARSHLQPATGRENDLRDPEPRPRSLLRPCAEIIAADVAAIGVGLARLPAAPRSGAESG